MGMKALAVLRPREELRILRGHPWVYDNEIARVEGDPAPGQAIAVESARGRSLGSGFFNPASKLRIRLYSRARREADGEFLLEALSAALAYRRRFYDPDTQSLRIAFGEADGLPGLIVDSYAVRSPSGAYGKHLCVQMLSLGMEARREAVVEALRTLLSPESIMERSDAPVRALEGLAPRTGQLLGETPREAVIEENGLRFAVDLAGGQKTGWFLDQRENRAAAARWARGRTVLDAFSHLGGFACACAAAGAGRVTAIDISSEAARGIAANAGLNGLSDRITALEGNAFDFLRDREREGERFGLVILDPPAFAKNRASIEGAYRGYKEINLRAMRLLEPGGTLVTCSCSRWFSPARFYETIEDAAGDSGRRMRFLEKRGQALDHPVLAGYEESEYLKCAILAAD